MSDGDSRIPPKRSSGALKHRRVPLPWPKDRAFRILAIDGGGIRGVFPAAFLAALEKRHLDRCSVACCFDLIAGTSTGGIVALGLGAGLGADEIRDLYVNRGCEVFPPVGDGLFSRIGRRLRDSRQLLRYRYDRDALARVLNECFGRMRFGDARTRLCIPSVDGRYGETYIRDGVRRHQGGDGISPIPSAGGRSGAQGVETGVHGLEPEADARGCRLTGGIGHARGPRSLHCADRG